MNWETYLALGDSITIGARTYLGYPELTGNLLEKQLNKSWNVINHAVSGYKAIDLARHIDLHSTTLQNHRSSVTSILIGTNDVKENTHPDDFRIALNQIILKAKLLTQNKNVILFTIPEFPEGVMYPYNIQQNDLVRTFNQIVQQLANEHSIRNFTLSLEPDDFTDGIHLNRKGISTSARQLAQFILKDKGLGNV